MHPEPPDSPHASLKPSGLRPSGRESDDTRDEPPAGKAPSATSPDGDSTTIGDMRQCKGEGVTEEAPHGPPLPSPPTGVRIPGFELQAELGRGGMGVVYRAVQLSLRRTVALKMILSGAYASAEARQRFFREAQALATLQHPSIVRIYDFGETAGQTFLAMEYIEGGDLTSLAPMEASRAAEIVRSLSEAVAHAHRLGIIHRDLKPANILVDGQGQPKITDFGLAKFALQESTQLTTAEQTLGTAAYMPPEQASGNSRHVGPEADIYSLGAVLYHLVSGQPPFLGKSNFEILKRVQQDPPWPLTRLVRQLPKDLDTICLKCLEKNPASRYASASDLAADLGRFLRGEPITARPQHLGQRIWRLLRLSAVAKVAAVLVFAAMAIAAWWWRDYCLYHRPTLSYVHHVELRQGDVALLKPLSRAQSQQRSETYRITRQGTRGPLHRIVSTDAAGHPVASSILSSLFDVGLDSILGGTPDVAILEFQRDAEGRIYRVRALDERQRERWTFVYTDPPDASKCLGYYLVGGLQRARTGYGATHVETTFDDDGRLQLVRFLDARGRPMASNSGSFAIRVQYEDRQQTYAFLDQDQQPMLVNGCHRVRLLFDEFDHVQTILCMSTGEEQQLCSAGFAQQKIQYDAFGNPVEYAYFDVHGQPTIIDQGYARSTLEYDEGRIIRERYFDEQGLPTVSKDGVHAVQYGCDDRGRVRRVDYLDVSDQPAFIIEGFARLVREYDAEGHVTAESVYDAEGKPAFDADGVFCSRYAFDTRGNRTRIQEVNSEGKQVTNRYGWSRMNVAYEDDREIQTLYFDEAGKPVWTTHGYAGVRTSYDDDGNVASETYLDPKGKPTIASNGYASKRYRYDQQGRRIEESCFGVDDDPILHVDGWHRVVYRRDARGMITERRFLNLAGEPTWHREGYSVQRSVVDNVGNELEVDYFGPQLEPVVPVDASARMVARYDALGHLVDVRYFDAEGKPTMAGSGGARIMTEYDPRGNPIRIRWFDTNGKPTTGALGAAIRENDYDHRGNVLESRNLGVDHQLRNVNGVARTRSRYDSRGHLIEQCYYAANGEPALDDGFFRITHRVDPRGNRIETRLYGPDGDPGTHDQGHSWIRRKFDQRGNLIEEELFDRENQPVVGANGYSRFVASYDRWNNRTAEAYFGLDNKPILGTRGFHRYQSTFDRGRVIETIYFGADGQRVRFDTGYAKIVREYDDWGRVTRERKLDVNDRPISTEQYAMVEYGYDYRGNNTELRWLDENEKPTIGPRGLARQQFEYDSLNREVLVRGFDAEGRPMRTPRPDSGSLKTLLASLGTEEHLRWLEEPHGYWQRQYQYDRYGNITQVRFLDVDGELTNNHLGYAETTASFNEDRELLVRAYFDQAGRQLTAEATIVVVLPNGKGEQLGLQCNDHVVRFADHPIFSSEQFMGLLRTVKGDQRVMEVRRGKESLDFLLPEATLGVWIVDVLRLAEEQAPAPSSDGSSCTARSHQLAHLAPSS